MYKITEKKVKNFVEFWFLLLIFYVEGVWFVSSPWLEGDLDVYFPENIFVSQCIDIWRMYRELVPNTISSRLAMNVYQSNQCVYLMFQDI